MKAVIIEDEALLSGELVNKLKNKCPDVKTIEILPSLKTARRWMMENAEPDLYFMDIQLSDGVSFELFDAFQIGCPVVFTTAYDEFALKAFKVNGVDYLLKPIDEEELKTAVDKCRKIIESKAAYPKDIAQLVQRLAQPNASTYKEKFIIHQRHQWVPVNTKDIAVFVKDTLHYLYTFNGDKHILDFDSIEEIEDVLDPKQFYRANRQTLLNIKAVQSVRPHENQKLTISLKPPLKMQVDISREKAPQFKRWFDR